MRSDLFKIKVAIAGTGKIVPESIEALTMTGYDVVSIWGPHKEKAIPIAERYNINHVCGSYEDLLISGVDFVYIALVNTVHFDYAVKALLAGVNVLLEKPFCSNASQAEYLASLCKEKGLYLFETISNIYQPAWTIVKQYLPEIGKIKMFQASFSQYSSRYDAYLAGDICAVFDPEYEGGALRDLNVYNLHLAVDLFGAPDQVIYRANKGYNGVDTSGTVILKYPDIIAVCSASKDASAPSGVLIQGENGWIRINGMPNVLQEVEVNRCSHVGETFSPNRYTSRLCHQFEEMRRIYLNGEYTQMQRKLSHTVRVMSTLNKCADEIYIQEKG